MLVVKYPNEKMVAIIVKTVNGTRMMALALIDLSMHLTHSFSLIVDLRFTRLLFCCSDIIDEVALELVSTYVA